LAYSCYFDPNFCIYDTTVAAYVVYIMLMFVRVLLLSSFNINLILRFVKLLCVLNYVLPRSDYDCVDGFVILFELTLTRLLSSPVGFQHQ
jgi:hypothetical protein